MRIATTLLMPGPPSGLGGGIRPYGADEDRNLSLMAGHATPVISGIGPTGPMRIATGRGRRHRACSPSSGIGPTGPMRIATARSITSRGGAPKWHRPYGADEDRNKAKLRQLNPHQQWWHRPYGADEDRNLAKVDADKIAKRWHRPYGADEDRNSPHATTVTVTPLGVAHRPVLHCTVAVVDEPGQVGAGGLAAPDRHPQRVQRQLRPASRRSSGRRRRARTPRKPSRQRCARR